MELKLVPGDGDIVRIDAAGQITQAEFGTAREPLGELLGEGRYARKVILNLAGTTFVDSSGLGWLLMCHKRFREADGRFVLCSLPAMVHDVIRIMKLNQVLRIAEDDRAASAMLQANSAS